MKEKYLNYKLEYKHYVLLFKSGNFYLSLNNEAIVMSNIFKYKIKDSTNFLKTGFPINALNKVLSELDNKHVNYVVIDNEIILKQKYKENNYINYMTDIEMYISKINNITTILKNNINHRNMKKIIDDIEKVVWQINY